MTNKRTGTAKMPPPDRPTPEHFLAAFPLEIRALADQLRAPNADDLGCGRSGLPWLATDRLSGAPGRRSRYFCFIAPFEDRVTLGFEYGVLLTNDSGLLEGTGTHVRYVTIRQPEDIRGQELPTLIAEAAIVAATLKRR